MKFRRLISSLFNHLLCEFYHEVGVKGFVSGTCSPSFEGLAEISYFNVDGINFSKLIFDFAVATEALW
jgi:hypothetical protein